MKWKTVWQLAAVVTGVVIIIAIVAAIVKQRRKQQVEESTGDKNVNAFIDTIRFAEGTDAADGWNYVFGSRPSNTKRFHNMSDHPAFTGEWNGEVLPKEMCLAIKKGDGTPIYPDGICKSYAAGAGQFTKATWTEAKAALDLPDFSEASQRKAFIYLFIKEDALDDIKAGKFEDAVLKVANRWASLPGNNYRQPQKSMADLNAKFTNKGGTIYST